VDTRRALEAGIGRLVELQQDDGSWEGEMVWCPMLTAQYVVLHHLMGRSLPLARRRNVIRSFAATRLEGGTWGMHEHSAPHLFVTALIYVAARTLDIGKDDPLIAPARRFLQREGVENIPSWGKFWLAILNLYDWRGVNAVLPEIWRLPRWVPLHPGNWYCHTRLIYMAMSVIYARRFQTPLTPLIASLRDELYPEGFEQVDFERSRHLLREDDLFERPGRILRFGFEIARLAERFHHRGLRQRCVEQMVEQIRWEIRTTRGASVSPVSGILNILALWLENPDDPDSRMGFDALEGWIWEDEEAGARITGARSASWDTGFATQALAGIPKDISTSLVEAAMERGAGYLAGEQIEESFPGYRDAWRNDPRGGWCFPGARHGWPVTDCTAEALLGVLAARGSQSSEDSAREAIRFMLRGQNRDGGFGSYESRRSLVPLEWLNPAEMFGESMTESSFVECTASCLAAMSAARKHFPGLDGLDEPGMEQATERADRWLRRTQGEDGSWRGVWGIQFLYGTWFGMRGLLAAGARPDDPRLRLACRWLRDRQREDGGWGEHFRGCFTGRYVPHTESQIVQTAWVMIALLEAEEPDWRALSRGARFLVESQDPDGGWPKQDNAGVFFRTALLDYVLYRQYFPLHALGLYEARRRATDRAVSGPDRSTSA